MVVECIDKTINFLVITKLSRQIELEKLSPRLILEPKNWKIKAKVEIWN